MNVILVPLFILILTPLCFHIPYSFTLARIEKVRRVSTITGLFGVPCRIDAKGIYVKLVFVLWVRIMSLSTIDGVRYQLRHLGCISSQCLFCEDYWLSGAPNYSYNLYS